VTRFVPGEFGWTPMDDRGDTELSVFEFCPELFNVCVWVKLLDEGFIEFVTIELFTMFAGKFALICLNVFVLLFNTPLEPEVITGDASTELDPLELREFTKLGLELTNVGFKEGKLPAEI